MVAFGSPDNLDSTGVLGNAKKTNIRAKMKKARNKEAAGIVAEKVPKRWPVRERGMSRDGKPQRSSRSKSRERPEVRPIEAGNEPLLPGGEFKHRRKSANPDTPVESQSQYQPPSENSGQRVGDPALAYSNEGKAGEPKTRRKSPKFASPAKFFKKSDDNGGYSPAKEERREEASPRRKSLKSSPRCQPPPVAYGTSTDVAYEPSNHRKSTAPTNFQSQYQRPLLEHGRSNDETLVHFPDEAVDRYKGASGDDESFIDHSKQPRPYSQYLHSAAQPPPYKKQHVVELQNNISEITSQTFSNLASESEEVETAGNRAYQEPPERVVSEASMESDLLFKESEAWSGELIHNRQKVAVLSLVLTSLQLGILIIQLVLCGLASVEVNPMIGPFPDAFSEWGGKNAYLMLEKKQYFRIITPVFLHVGILQLLINAFCQLETCAFFEREWGSCRWLTLYLISGVGCVATSCVFNPDEIAVCSSGALMGLFGAKIGQVITWSAHELRNPAYYELVHIDQLGGVMCSAALVSFLSFFTYIDWSGHLGGFVAGFLGGIFMFSKAIRSTCAIFMLSMFSLSAFVCAGYLLGYWLWYKTNPDEDLGDACQYFRNLYPEGYDCECAWG